MSNQLPINVIPQMKQDFVADISLEVKKALAMVIVGFVVIVF